MPRRKKLPEIPENPNLTGLGREDKNPQDWLIQKTKPLTTLSHTSMTLSEFKILDAYLSRIDSNKPNKRYVRFEKGELEKLLDVEKINKADLNKRLRNLFQTLEIYDERKPKGFTLIALFTKAECEQDENGLWQVNLACSAEAMEYIFNPENLTYLKYRLKNVINLTSRYSYIMFLYLLDNRWRKVWTVDIDELKTILRCTAARYDDFKYFNGEILKSCHKELSEKTDFKFSYEPDQQSRKGRRYTKIRFIIETISDIESPDEQLTLFEEIRETAPIGSIEERLAFMSEACDNRFSIEQIQCMLDMLIQIFPVTGSDIDRYNYLRQKYNELVAEEARKKSKKEKKILYPDKYLMALIKKDIPK